MTVVTSLTRVQVVVKNTLPTQLQRSAKSKILHWFYWSVYLAYQVLIFCKKTIFSNHFGTLFLLTYYRLINFYEMFIFSKSRCCCSTFTNVLFTSLLTKEYLNKKNNYFQMRKFSIPSAILSEIFICIANISRSYEENLRAAFFHSRCIIGWLWQQCNLLSQAHRSVDQKSTSMNYQTFRS